MQAALLSHEIVLIVVADQLVAREGSNEDT